MNKIKRLSPTLFQCKNIVLFAITSFIHCNTLINNNSERVQLITTTPSSLPEQIQDVIYNTYFGDIHNHSAISDGKGTAVEAYIYAREKAGLDFFSLSDHARSISKDEWAETRKAADSLNDDGAYVTLWGFEWSSGNGHVTILNTDDFCKSYVAEYNEFNELCEWLSPRNGIAFFNHPDCPERKYEFLHFSSSPMDQFVGIELWNKKNGFERYYYNDGYYPDDNNKSYYDEALSRGWKIGASGGGDNHWATWGTNTDFRLAILAAHLTRRDILNALKARRFYSTLDKNIRLSFKIDGNEMGSTISGSSHTVNIHATDGDNELFTEIVLYNADHDTVKIWNPGSCIADIIYTLNEPDNNYYYLKIRQYDGDEAISSPIWIVQ